MSESSRTWIIYTDLDPQTLSAVSYTIFQRWVAFAMGKEQIQGFQLKHPTGRYASSISRRTYSPYRIAIMSDEKMAPEGVFLEEGHGEIDLKDKLQRGRTYPMHRGQKGSFGSAGYGSPILSRSKGDRRKNIWAEPRSQGFSGFAKVPETITAENANSWIIPPMPAYSPAAHLVDLFKRGAFG